MSKKWIVGSSSVSHRSHTELQHHGLDCAFRSYAIKIAGHIPALTALRQAVSALEMSACCGTHVCCEGHNLSRRNGPYASASSEHVVYRVSRTHEDANALSGPLMRRLWLMALVAIIEIIPC